MAGKWTESETWDLIMQIKLSENFKVLYGQAANENSSGDTKHAVHQCIALSLWAGNGEAGDTFKEKVKLLKKTGEGIKEWYQISPTGPDHDTEPRTVSIWDQIVLEPKHFPDLYCVWSTKPNLVPICATTGVGPNGDSGASSTTHMASQPPVPVSPGPLIPSALSASNSASSVISSPLSPVYSPLTPNSVTKENSQPPTSCQQAPHFSAFSSISFTGNGKKKPVAVAPKAGFEDKMIGLQQEMLKNVEKQASNTQVLKRLHEERKIEDQCLKQRKLLQDACTQLLTEFQSNIWTVEQYHSKRNKLNELYGSPKKVTH
ncbi:hypothetical protein BDP27DRAFT_1506192 [Rhodocollybia butyracea]|uniref:Uncharacterized protein n=1 Tax=Rhodocollybia butyracea TaxID=206335 RepID=A0A9P5TYP2_9AGAR|nr:hypothetical protein BDP27DRAFT_1506192 [Rhodocollybia butyracea]